MNLLSFLGPKKVLTKEQAQELIKMAQSVKEGLDNGGRVSYASLKSVPFARTAEDAMIINERIECFHLEMKEDHLSIWDVHMQPDSQFGIHDHDAVEQIWVLKGSCTVDGVKVGRFGTRRFGREKEHNIRSEKGCHLIVLFSDPE